MPWTVQTSSKLDPAKRKQQAQKVRDNGLEPYARFQTKEAAQEYADLVFKNSKVKLAVNEVYSVSFNVL